MEEYSEPATLADFKALVASLNRQGAEYLLLAATPCLPTVTIVQPRKIA